MIFNLCNCNKQFKMEKISPLEKDDVIREALSTPVGMECLATAMNEPIRRYAEFHFASRHPLLVDELPPSYVNKYYDESNRILQVRAYEEEDKITAEKRDNELKKGEGKWITVKTRCLKATKSIPFPKSNFEEIDRLQIRLADDLQKQEEAFVFDELIRKAQIREFEAPYFYEVPSINEHVNDVDVIMPVFNTVFREFENIEDTCLLVENVFGSDKMWKEITNSCFNKHHHIHGGTCCGIDTYSTRDILTCRQYGILWTANMRACNELSDHEYLISVSPDMTGVLYLIKDIETKLTVENNELCAETQETVAMRLLNPLYVRRVIINW